MDKRLFFRDDDNWRGQLFTLFMLLFVFGWIFWAFQLDRPGVLPTHKQVKQERINRDAMIEYGSGIVAKAEKLGNSYGPKQCYATDFRLLYLKDKVLHHPTIGGTECRLAVSGRLEHLMKLLDQNQQKLSGKQAEEFAMERYREADRFRAWQAKYCPQSAAFDGVARSLKKFGWLGILGWLAIFYLRSVVMSALLYLLVIAKRDGLRAVIPTVCRQKARYAIASIAWPAFFWRFPYNILRELWVEVQFRRLGGLFRRLSTEEREMIREKAALANPEYRKWRQGFGQQAFRRGILIALLGTLVLRVWACGYHETARCVGPITCSISTSDNSRDGPGLHERSTDNHDESSNGQQVGILPDVKPIKSVELWWPLPVLPVLKKLLELSDVFHVPVSRPAVSFQAN